MQVGKLRIAVDESGLVPAGQYFKRLARALREANEREAHERRRSPNGCYRELEHRA